MANANQSLADTRGNYNLKDLVTECELQSTMESVHPGESLQSTNRGSKTIDQILAAGIERNNITQAGHLPFGLGFHTDHRGVFADMNGDNKDDIVISEEYLDVQDHDEPSVEIVQEITNQQVVKAHAYVSKLKAMKNEDSSLLDVELKLSPKYPNE